MTTESETPVPTLDAPGGAGGAGGGGESETPVPTLDAPGAGLPAIQELVLRHVLFPILKRSVSWERALAVFEREGRRTLAEVRGVSEEQRTMRILVPRMMGIEDSSRYWSLAMTLDHILIVSRGVSALMARLSRGEDVDAVVDTAQVKPEADPPKDIDQRFEAFLAEFPEQLRVAVTDRNTSRCHVHPWFGCLNPHGWLVMLAVHQFIHRRQITRIRKRLESR